MTTYQVFATNAKGARILVGTPYDSMTGAQLKILELEKQLALVPGDKVVLSVEAADSKEDA